MSLFILLFSLFSILLFYCIAVYLAYKEEDARITIAEGQQTNQQSVLSFVDNLSDGVMVIDNKNQIALINEPAKRLLSIEKTSITIDDIIAALSKTLDINEKIQQARNTNSSIEEKQVLVGDKTMDISIAPVLSMNSGISIILHDKSAEKEMGKMKEDFINDVLHEIRSPLTAIQGAATIMATGDTTEEEKTKFLGIIMNQAKKLFITTASLLDGSKIENNTFLLNKQPQDLKKIIDQSLDLFTGDAKAKNVQLITDFPPNLPQVMVDTARISESITNILNKLLKLTTTPATISIKASEQHGNIVVSIIDTNMTMSEDIQRIFGTASRAQPDGIHSGLLVSKQIIESHGGTITLESSNQGATLSFTLPVAETKHQDTNDSDKGLLLPNESFGRMVN